MRSIPSRRRAVGTTAQLAHGVCADPSTSAAGTRADGQTEHVKAALAEMDGQERDAVFMRTVIATLRLAGDDPQAPTVALAPVMAGSGPAAQPIWLVEALLLEAIARDALGDAGAVHRATEGAVDLAEPDGMLLPFFLHPVGELLKRHRRPDPAAQSPNPGDPKSPSQP